MLYIFSNYIINRSLYICLLSVFFLLTHFSLFFQRLFLATQRRQWTTSIVGTKQRKKNSSLSWVSRIILLQEMQRSGITLVDLWLLLFSYWRSLHTLKNGVRQVKCNHAKKMSSYGTLWLFLLQCFGVRKSYYKQVILCISRTDFEGSSLVQESPLTNQITKR